MATVKSGIGTNGSGFSNSDTVTSTTLNNHVNDATVTNIVNDDIATNAAIVVTKLAEITNQNVLGNIGSGNASVPIVGATGILKNDDSLGTSDTQGATQGNIKAYVDALRPNIVNVVKTDAAEITISTRNTYVDIPTMEKAITTKKADSTFIVSAMLNFGFTDTSKIFAVKCQYKVGSGSYTDFNLADSAGSATRSHLQVQQSVDNASYIDNFQLIVPLVDPAYTVGDVLTFKLLVAGVNDTDNIFINRGQSSDTTDFRSRTISTLTVQEV